jgi:hypothetical protein
MPSPPFFHQVLILKDFKDFPSDELTLEFWMMSTGGALHGCLTAPCKYRWHMAHGQRAVVEESGPHGRLEL